MKYRIGLVCPPFTGHLNPMLSLAVEIVRRGYEVILFHYDTDKDISRFNKLKIDTISLGEQKDAINLINRDLLLLSSLSGSRASDLTVEICRKVAEINLQLLPKKIKITKCDALLIDQSLFEGETIAAITKLPFITICNALIVNPDLEVSPPFIGWQPDRSIVGLIRNFCGYLYTGAKLGRTQELVNKYREQKNLPPYPSFFQKEYFEQIWSSIATISQQPAVFEFPRSMDKTFHFTAPFIDPQIRKKIDFPWERINGKPLIYASIGTLQNSVYDIYYKIAQACSGVNCQLVISCGKENKNIQIDNLPEDAIVIDYAPQLELLPKVKLCITHAGINTALECLSYGVSMVAIPIANDQPGIAARIEWTGTGKVLDLRCSISELNWAIKEVLYNNVYRENTIKMQKIIQEANGVELAANIIEKTLIFNSESIK